MNEDKKEKRVFVMDMENTNDFEFIKTYKVNSKDEIILFISEKSKPIPAKDLHYITLNKLKAKTEYVSVGTANAMDFQIISYIALNIGAKNKKKFFVVSNDKGFELAIDYIESKSKNTIEMIYKEKSPKKKKKKNQSVSTINSNENLIRDEILNLIETELKVKDISEKIKTIDFQNKALVHNQLVSKFGEKGKEIYKIIKPTLLA